MAHLNPHTQLLHSKELKSTPLRLELLKVLFSVHRPLTAEDIQKKMHSIEFDQASLFRALKKFTEVGIIKTIDLGEGFHRYEAICEEHGHHHHVMCTLCKKIEVIPFCIPKEIETYLKKIGYKNLGHRMDFFGFCKTCQS